MIKRQPVEPNATINIQEEILKWAKKTQTSNVNRALVVISLGVSLKELTDFGDMPSKNKLTQSAKWLHHEL